MSGRNFSKFFKKNNQKFMSKNNQKSAITANRAPNLFEEMTFPNGHTAQLDRENQELRLLDDRQNMVLSIKMTDGGLVVNLQAFQLNLTALDELNFFSKKIKMAASEDFSIETGGNFTQKTVGDAQNSARSHQITADLGNVNVKANDDVRLDGERIKLNCDPD
jgi:hypothetical protein